MIAKKSAMRTPPIPPLTSASVADSSPCPEQPQGRKETSAALGQKPIRDLLGLLVPRLMPEPRAQGGHRTRGSGRTPDVETAPAHCMIRRTSSQEVLGRLPFAGMSATLHRAAV